MRIDLNSTTLIPSIRAEIVDTDATLTSLSYRIAKFSLNQKCTFDADHQVPLGTTGKTATLGKKLLFQAIS